MIALLAAGGLSAAVATATPQPSLAPEAVLAKYAAAIKALKEPRVFAFEYTLQQTGTRNLEQVHRVFRSGRDERDEMLAVNGTRSTSPVVRIFRGRPYRYSVAALAPKPAAYGFTYAGPHRDGKHVDYVFTLVPKKPVAGLAFTQVTIDGLTFLPQTVAFATRQHAGSGTVSFAKAEKYWVARGATAQATVTGGIARERLAFARWRFPGTLPRSTFAMPRPLPTLRPILP